jgi:hypothetical protein
LFWRIHRPLVSRFLRVLFLLLVQQASNPCHRRLKHTVLWALPVVKANASLLQEMLYSHGYLKLIVFTSWENALQS